MVKATKKKTRPRKKQAPSFIGYLMSSAGSFVVRHPAWVCGPLMFGIAFSFVSANAIWYQPGPHPEPLFKTRQSADPYAVPGQPPAARHETYDTFRIEREGKGPPDFEGANARLNDLKDKQGSEDDLEAILRSVEAVTPAPPVISIEASPPELQSDDHMVIVSLQQKLADRGYYKGKADGVSGPVTVAAIRHFQADQGLKQTGVVGDAVAELLVAQKSDIPPVPTPRSRTSVAIASAVDPVADFLSTNVSGNRQIENLARASGSVITTDTMVIEIQRGLVNIAYDDVTVDGVVGNNTRQAILQFQKHYRLPETGEPSSDVLGKLKEIGAL